MKPFRSYIEQLAFQVDRKILELEEEDHLRLDIPAGERLIFRLRTMLAPLPWHVRARQFAGTAVAIFALLFTVTNAPSYGKILAANLSAWQEARVEQAAAPVVEPLAMTPALGELFPLLLKPTTFENRIEVPSVKVNAPLVEPEQGVEALKGQDWNRLEEEIHESLQKGVVHYPGTAQAGEKGNAFYTGHSSNVFWEVSPYNTVFALLPKIKVDDDIFITENQNRFHYKVTEIKEVSPKEVGVLEQGEGKMLTLMTCTPVGTRLKRLIVRAELVE